MRVSRGKPKERGNTEGLDVDEIIKLKSFLKNRMGVNLISLVRNSDR